ncbi:MAG: cytochrome c maturation protein CcmE [Rhodospirillales bacterium]|nr:MAG: cytochrome c maturation protein CcmE [Rhodospirillales bacterium]
MSTTTPATPKHGLSRAATRKRKRLYIVLAGMTMLGVAVALMLTAFKDNIVFFYTPSDLTEKVVKPEHRVRLGGLVEDGSVRKAADGVTTEFVITDHIATIPVSYTGILPDLFREGQGVVAEGHIGPDGSLQATEVLAKHDENYMPKEVADKIKESGRWQEGGSGG